MPTIREEAAPPAPAPGVNDLLPSEEEEARRDPVGDIMPADPNPDHEYDNGLRPDDAEMAEDIFDDDGRLSGGMRLFCLIIFISSGLRV